MSHVTPSRPIPVTLLLGLSTVIAGCTMSFEPAREDPRDATLAERSARVEGELARLRDLPFASSVPVDTKDRDALAQVLRHEIDEEFAGDLASLERAYKTFGLLPGALDLRTYLVDLMREEVAGYYDPEEKRFFTVEDEAADADDAAEGDRDFEDQLEDGIVLPHELTHALEDQHFDLEALSKGLHEDADLALSGLVEGSAMEAGVDHVLWRFGTPFSTASPSVRWLVQIVGSLPAGQLLALGADLDLDDVAPDHRAAAERLREAPSLLRGELLFPYLRGLGFVNRLRSEFGWRAVDEAYRDPPESSEQVLFPERYFDRRDRPVVIRLPEPPAGWTAVHQDTLGMWRTMILLGDGVEPDAAEDAEFWDGDRYALCETAAGDALGWVSAWDAAGDAKTFEAALRTLLKLRGGDASRWAVTRRDDVVAAVIDAPPGEAAAAAAHYLDGATLERAADDRSPDRWYGNLARWPLALRFLDRATQFHVAGGWGLEWRGHDGGHRLRVGNSLLLHSENNSDRTALWVALGLVGFTRDRTLDYSFARIPFLWLWHGRGTEPDERRAKFSLLLRSIDYENQFGTRQFDLLWGGLTRVRWGEEARDGRRVRILGLWIPGI